MKKKIVRIKVYKYTDKLEELEKETWYKAGIITEHQKIIRNLENKLEFANKEISKIESYNKKLHYKVEFHKNRYCELNVDLMELKSKLETEIRVADYFQEECKEWGKLCSKREREINSLKLRSKIYLMLILLLVIIIVGIKSF